MHKLRHILTASLVLVLITVSLSGCGPDLFQRVNNFWALGICGMIIVILSIIAIVEIAGSQRPTGNKALWIIFIILFPGLGVLIYYLFAR